MFQNDILVERRKKYFSFNENILFQPGYFILTRLFCFYLVEKGRYLTTNLTFSARKLSVVGKIILPAPSVLKTRPVKMGPRARTSIVRAGTRGPPARPSVGSMLRQSVCILWHITVQFYFEIVFELLYYNKIHQIIHHCVKLNLGFKNI